MESKVYRMNIYREPQWLEKRPLTNCTKTHLWHLSGELIQFPVQMNWMECWFRCDLRIGADLQCRSLTLIRQMIGGNWLQADSLRLVLYEMKVAVVRNWMSKTQNWNNVKTNGEGHDEEQILSLRWRECGKWGVKSGCIRSDYFLLIVYINIRTRKPTRLWG